MAALPNVAFKMWFPYLLVLVTNCHLTSALSFSFSFSFFFFPISMKETVSSFCRVRLFLCDMISLLTYRVLCIWMKVF